MSCVTCRRATRRDGQPMLAACLDCHPLGVPCTLCGRSSGLRTFGAVCRACYVPTDTPTTSTIYGGGEPDPLAVGLFAPDLESGGGRA